MKQTAFSRSNYSNIAKAWFILYMIISFVFGFHFILIHSLQIPYIAIALLNLYAITLLIKEKKNGFYILFSLEILYIIFTIIRNMPTFYLSIGFINFICIFITWIFVRKLWDVAK